MQKCIVPSVASGASSSSVSLAIVERILGEFVDVPALRVQEQKVEVDTIPQDHVPQDHVLDRLVLLHMNEYNGSSNNSTQFPRISRRIARTRRCSMCLRRASTNASWSSWEFSLHFRIGNHRDEPDLSQERISECDVKPIGDLPVPQTLEQAVEMVRFRRHERAKRTVEQNRRVTSASYFGRGCRGA